MASSADSTAKRSGPEIAGDRAPKRRASRACLNCRNRKVRCDVVNGGLPCTNCRLDSLSCEVTESNRTKRAAQGANTAKSPQQEVVQDRRRSNPPHDQADQFPVSLTFEDQLGLSRANEDFEEDCRSISTRSPGFGSSQASTTQHQQRLPRYIKPLPPHIRAEDIEYLAMKDALTIPEDELRDELLRHYIKIVHPVMPILEVNDFVPPIIQGDGSNPVSLLLFQAVMFVSVTFVDINVLRSQGYQCRKSARKRFFRRVRLLYGLDCEPDRLALIQALLLMTFWYDAPEDEKDTWYWMGISLSLAQVIGLHRDPENLRISTKAKRHRIRLWWSCLMRDRLLALGIRRPARVRPDDFNVPMLTLDDFNTGPVPDEVAKLLGWSALTQDIDLQRTLATTCIELVKLCMCIGHVLLSQYSVLGNHPVGSESSNTVMVFPRKADGQNQEMAKCDEELNEWYQNLEPCNRYTPHSSSRSSLEKGDETNQIIRLHQTSLYMIYLTAQGALHRPQVFRKSSNLEVDEATRSASRQKVTDAAIKVTQLAHDTQLHNLLRYLSTSSIPAFVSAALIHLLDICSNREEVRNASVGRFFQCMQVLRQLQDMYSSADYAIYFLETVIQNTGIHIPMFSLGQPHNRSKPHPANGGALSVPSMLNTGYTSHSEPSEKTYPTPSSFGNQPVLVESPPLSSHGATNLQMKDPAIQAVESAGLPLNATGSLTPGSQNYSSMFPHDNAEQASPQQGNWNEVDSLLSALINFDNDPGFCMSPSVNANG